MHPNSKTNKYYLDGVKRGCTSTRSRGHRVHVGRTVRCLSFCRGGPVNAILIEETGKNSDRKYKRETKIKYVR